MSTFWIVGIVINVTLTGLILFWLIRQAKPRAPREERPPDGGKEIDPE